MRRNLEDFIVLRGRRRGPSWGSTMGRRYGGTPWQQASDWRDGRRSTTGGPRICLGASGGASCLAGGRARGAGLVCESGGPCGGGAPRWSAEGSWGPIRLGSEEQFLCAVFVR